MPPRASHRLTVFVVPAPGTGRDAFARLRALSCVLVGGNGAVSFEAHGTERFLANGQGGFRVACPTDGAPIAGLFSRALQAWREGAPRALDCHCGSRHDLAGLRFDPPAAFAREWLRIDDAASAEFTPEALRALGEGVRVVWRRG